jgi:hypothetical protein
MSNRVPCEFFLVRYVPDVVKGEFVNIGVVLRAAERSRTTSGPEPARLRFTRDWSRVRCIDANADIALLEELEQEFGHRLGHGEGYAPSNWLPLLESSLSNSIQMTEPRAVLAENLTTEMEQLMRLYVEPMASPRQSTHTSRRASSTGRTAIQTMMRTNFEKAGVWPLMNKRLAAERYTRKGDPLRIDCGYRREVQDSLGESYRMFQAVSLEGDGELARALAYAAPELQEGVFRVDGAPLVLTAVVEPLRAIVGEEGLLEGGELADRYRFGVETMERSQIRVVTMSDLARVAATAQRELGL